MSCNTAGLPLGHLLDRPTAVLSAWWSLPGYCVLSYICGQNVADCYSLLQVYLQYRLLQYTQKCNHLLFSCRWHAFLTPVCRAGIFTRVARLDPRVPAHDALRLKVDTYESRKPMASWRRPPGRPRNVLLNKV